MHSHRELEESLGLNKEHVIVDRSDWVAACAPLVLSRRNLLTLLYKLTQPDSHRTLIKPGGRCVMAEPDEIHYKDRKPGPMSSDTETHLAAVDPWQKASKILALIVSAPLSPAQYDDMQSKVARIISE